MIHNDPPAILTVSLLNQQVKLLLENEMGHVWLTGEISNFSQPVSGHWYFTLKDANAQVRCAMFRNTNLRVGFRPQNGQQVLIRAALTLYEARGEYQLIAQSMQPAGDGLLQQRFDELKRKLMAEGLFDQQHKQPLPKDIRTVGVVTSATGAALHDILHVLKRRDPSLSVIIYPTPVQGDEAPAKIACAIAIANARAECDVLIVGRGGGSLEDLWAFNEEIVARAIYHCEIPIVSAVGHEVDVTIADFVADVRAPTPSAAAELVSQNKAERHQHLLSLYQKLGMAFDYYLAHRRNMLARKVHALQQQHPKVRLAKQHTLLIKQQNQLEEALRVYLKKARIRQQQQQQRLSQLSPERTIKQYQQKLQTYYFVLQQKITAKLNTSKQDIAILASQLDAVSPLATLARGYSITMNEDHKIIRHIDEISTDDTLITTVSDGIIKSKVMSTHSK